MLHQLQMFPARQPSDVSGSDRSIPNMKNDEKGDQKKKEINTQKQVTKLVTFFTIFLKRQFFTWKDFPHFPVTFPHLYGRVSWFTFTGLFLSYSKYMAVNVLNMNDPSSPIYIFSAIHSPARQEY